MFNVKNQKTGKLIKDPISGKPHSFDDVAHAQKWADNMTRNSTLNATAWNSVRPSRYIVVPT